MTIRELLRGLPTLTGSPPPFDPDHAPSAPLPLFHGWFAEAVAAGVREPQAMTVSTVDSQARPDARVLILKDVSDAGFSFATSAASAKGGQLAHVAYAALSFYWREHGRQIRIRGPVTMAEPAISAADFLARPPAARVAGLVGRQSEVLADAATLARAAAAATRLIEDEPAAVAKEHTVYVVAAESVEFWQTDASRQHLRLRYRRSGTGWIRERLWP
jgi:pyridoxamine 5'-phosphate oxidase